MGTYWIALEYIKREGKDMDLKKCFWILTILGTVLVFFSIILGFCDKDWASVIGIISTVVSIILAMGSFIYSFISGEKTLQYLNEIKAQNDALVERLNYELSKANYGQKNIESIDRMISEPQGKVKSDTEILLNNKI